MNMKIMNLNEECGKCCRWLVSDFESIGVYVANEDALDAIYEQIHSLDGRLVSDGNVLDYLGRHGVSGDVGFAVSSDYEISKGLWLLGKKGVDYESAEKLAKSFEALKPNLVKS